MLRGYIMRKGRGQYLYRLTKQGARDFTIYAYDAAVLEKMTMAEAVLRKLAKQGEHWEIRYLDKVQMTEEVQKVWA